MFKLSQGLTLALQDSKFTEKECACRLSAAKTTPKKDREVVLNNIVIKLIIDRNFFMYKFFIQLYLFLILHKKIKIAIKKPLVLLRVLFFL